MQKIKHEGRRKEEEEGEEGPRGNQEHFSLNITVTVFFYLK